MREIAQKLSRCSSFGALMDDAFARCPEREAIVYEDWRLTYGDLVGVAIADRRNLSLCAEQNRFLVQAVTACNAAIAEHNRKLDEVNAELSKRR